MFKKKSKPEDQLDIINRKIFEIFFYVKWVLIALFVYLTILTISEGVFTLQNINSNAVGRSRPWETKQTYRVSNQNPNLELSSEIINM